MIKHACDHPQKIPVVLKDPVLHINSESSLSIELNREHSEAIYELWDCC